MRIKDLLSEERAAVPPKPRNFVAKNAKMGGAGAHKDKKKAEKQGDTKHKNKSFDMAEGKEDKIAQLKKDHATAVHWSQNERSPQKREAARRKAETIKAHLEKQYKQGVAEVSEPDLQSQMWELGKKYNSMPNGPEKEAVKQQYFAIKKQIDQQSGKWGMTAQNAPASWNQQGMAEDTEQGNVSDTELDTIDPQDHGSMEGSFVKNQIHTMLRVLKHLEHAIGDDEDLPEWVQMKLSQAQESVVGVMNFMISDKEREVERRTGNDSLMKEELQARLAELKAKVEGVGIPFRGVGGAFNRGDDERHDLDDVELKQNRQEVTYYNITIDGKPINPKPIFGRSATIAWGKEQVAAGVDFSNAKISPVQYTEDAYMESLTNMLERSVSQAQHNLMVGVAHNPAFAQKVKVKQKVGQEFANADQGHDISKLPIRVPKKK